MNRQDAKTAKGAKSEIDDQATGLRRDAIREARRQGAASPESPLRGVGPAGVNGGWSITEYVELVPPAGILRCRRCGTSLADAGEDFKVGCLRRSDPLTAAGPHRGEAYDRGRFHLAVYLCPGCLTLLDADVVLDGAPPVRAVITRLPDS